MTSQQGGTLLGLMIGAVIGLGAALAVAVYITKVPVPFMNKGQSRSPDHDAAEAKKNKDWNPNAPLSGKNPAKPAAVEPQPGDVTPKAPVTVLKPAGASSAPVDSAAKTAKPAADPLGDLAKAKMATPAPAAAPVAAAPSTGADPFNYFVQVGAFRTPEDAEQQRAKISLMGLEARVSEREQSGRTVFRVRLGPFDKKEDADKAKERLDGSGIETAMVRVQR
ncbi:MAG TPA: SPOR domain-containing protein [Polaromonas sp.]|uniref:SPOR domain-containing protein n=1 Tax=Polaromonas sp. TaxID=1869339 RepID=UPI002D53520B|nr:SPOR domain-containing protein [Polaromonas sp.]HYW55652.1 SPOR domain-containing protein [Polaromonas sp.]